MSHTPSGANFHFLESAPTFSPPGALSARSIARTIALVAALWVATACGDSDDAAGPARPGIGDALPPRPHETWNADLRRAVLGLESRFALPHAETGVHRYAITVPRGATLEVGFGLQVPKRVHRYPPVRFRVSFENGDESQLLLERSIRKDSKAKANHWFDASVSLEKLRGKTGTLVFRASRPRGELAPRALWSRPRLALDGKSPPPERGPNIILISVDTLRADHLGCYGYERPTSPNIDRMAAEGVRFENAMAASNWTLPSHASLFTGLHPSRHGADRFGLGTPITEPIDTLPEILFRRGFETAGFVGGVFVSAKLGFDQGFARFRDPGYSDFRRVPFARNLNSGLWWMNLQGKRPFFLFLHTYATHMPYVPAAPYRSMFDPDYDGPYRDQFEISDYLPYRYTDALEPRVVEHIAALYDEGIRQMDAQMGRLMEAIAKNESAQDTCVVFTSDHGDEFKEHGNLFHHNPKLFDELVRVPLIVWCPSRFAGGQVVDEVISLTDVLPTLLELTGSGVPEGLDGTSFLAALRGEPLAESRVAIAEVDGSTVEKPGAVVALRQSHFKLVASTLDGSERLSLYDLEQDPGEKRDIAAAEPEIAERMAARLREEVPVKNEPHVAAPDWNADPAMLERLRELGYIQ